MRGRMHDAVEVSVFALQCGGEFGIVVRRCARQVQWIDRRRGGGGCDITLELYESGELARMVKEARKS